MANKNVELMRGEPEKAVKKLAIPIMISMILTALYNIVDGIWVAGLGPTAIAGIGFVTPIFMVLNGASVGLGNGATSSISRFIGAKNREMATKSATQSMFIFLIASIVLTVIFIIIQEPLLRSYGATGQTLNEAIAYATPLFLGLIALMFEYHGKPSSAVRSIKKRKLVFLSFALSRQGLQISVRRHIHHRGYSS